MDPREFPGGGLVRGRGIGDLRRDDLDRSLDAGQPPERRLGLRLRPAGGDGELLRLLLGRLRAEEREARGDLRFHLLARDARKLVRVGDRLVRRFHELVRDDVCPVRLRDAEQQLLAAREDRVFRRALAVLRRRENRIGLGIQQRERPENLPGIRRRFLQKDPERRGAGKRQREILVVPEVASLRGHLRKESGVRASHVFLRLRDALRGGGEIRTRLRRGLHGLVERELRARDLGRRSDPRRGDREHREQDRTGGIPRACAHGRHPHLANECAHPLDAEVDDRHHQQREQRRTEDAADDGDRHRRAELAAGAVTDCCRQHAEHHRGRRHEDRTQAFRSGREDRLAWSHALVALEVEGRVDEEDGVFCHESHEENDSDLRAHRERTAVEPEGQDRADEGEGQREHDRGGVDEALELTREHDVDEEDGDAEGEAERGVRILHVLDVAQPVDVVPLRNERVDSRFRGREHLAERAARRGGGDENSPRSVFALDDGRPRARFDASDFPDVDCAALRVDRDASDGRRAVPERLGELDADVGLVLLAAGVDPSQRSCDFAVHRDVHVPAERRDGDVHLARLATVRNDARFGFSGRVVDADVGGAGDFGERRGDLLRGRNHDVVRGTGDGDHDRVPVAEAFDHRRFHRDDGRERILEADLARDSLELEDSVGTVFLRADVDAIANLVRLLVRSDGRVDDLEARVGDELLFDRGGAARGFVECRVRRIFDRQDELAAIFRRLEVAAEASAENDREREEPEGRGHDRLRVRDGPFERAVVEAIDRDEDARVRRLDAGWGDVDLARVALLRETRGEHGVQREGHDHREQNGRRDRQAELPEELPDDSGHERDRHEDRDDRHGGRENGERDLLRAFRRGDLRVLTHLEMPEDVLAHDDRVVDQEADRQRQAEHRQHVQRKAHDVHHQERADDRGGQRERRDEGRAQIHHEEEDDEDRHRAAEDDRDLHLVRVRLDVFRLVDQRSGPVLQILRDARLEVGERLAHVVGDLHGVGARSLHDLEGDGLLPVRADARPVLLEIIPNIRDLSDGDLAAVLRCEDHRVADVVDAAELADGAHADVLFRHRVMACGDRRVLRLELRHDCGRREAEALEFHRVEIDLDLANAASEHVYFRDAADLLERGFHVVLGDPADLVGGTRRARGIDHDRRGADVGLRDDRIFRAIGKLAPNRADFVADFTHRLVEVRVELEDDGDDRDVLAREAVDAVDAADGDDCVLDGLHDLPLHVFRGGAGVRHHDGHEGELHFGKQVGSEPGETEEPEHDPSEGEHRGENRPLDRNFADRHGILFVTARRRACADVRGRRSRRRAFRRHSGLRLRRGRGGSPNPAIERRRGRGRRLHGPRVSSPGLRRRS